MIRFILLFFSILGASIAPAMANVIATVSQNPIYVGHPFTLQVSVNAALPASDFDSAKLMQPHIIVGQTSTSRQMSDINGKTTRQTQWVTTLLIRKAGNYVIPALTIAGGQTQPIKLHAINATNKNLIQQQVHVETKIAQKRGWIGQSILYTAKILVASSLNNANFDGPHSQEASFIQVGQDQQKSEIINGKRYQVLTRHWLITPKQTGLLTIQGPRLTGIAGVPDPVFGITEQPVDVQGKTLRLQIMPKPAGFKTSWLAANHLTISDSIRPKTRHYKAGEAITRTITLTAEGAGLNQLPSLDIQYPAQLRVYPDKPKKHLFIKDGKIYAQKVYSFAIIPMHAGNISIPGKTITWWNIPDESRQYSKIPAVKLSVIANSNRAIKTTQSTPSISQPQETQTPNSHNWSWLFAGLWVLTTIGWIIREGSLHRTRNDNNGIQREHESEENTWKAFTQAAQSNQLQLSEKYLRQWVQSHPTYQQVMKLLLDELARLAWHPNSETMTWNGLEFLHRATQLKKGASSNHNGHKHELPPLNP
ncbi:MAG: hypothetical protein CENE_03583 [Candidatus Celerinatantimonas neptuna]|nr:MAG: hypothetical protein CENE_03583 [Candidatus Celerinatantimonas neptuna]